MRKTIPQKYTCFLFGEGRRDRNFLRALIDEEKFKYHTIKWFFTYDNASGCSADDVLKLCKKQSSGKSFDLIICFIDLDDLKVSFKKNWQDKKKYLEEKYLNFIIIWQEDNAEDEYRRALNISQKSKVRVNEIAIKNIHKFVKSNFGKRILKAIKNKEEALEGEAE